VEGLHSQIWLVGCIHLGHREDADVFGPYLEVYNQAEELYFETAPGSSDSYEAKTLMARVGYLPRGESLADSVSPATWKMLNTALFDDRDELRTMSRMRPWMAAFTFLHRQYELLGLTREYSLEALMQRNAQRDRKRVGGLETTKDELLAFGNADNQAQEEFLIGAVRNPEANDEQTRSLRRAWLRGDEGQLKVSLGFSRDTQPTVMDQRLVGQRNERWVKTFREIERRGKNAMIFVGVEHLITPHNSLIAHLRSQQLFASRCSDSSSLVAKQIPRDRPVLEPFLVEAASRARTPARSAE
jgi:uncharacterized protein YbaP (TraB family)